MSDRPPLSISIRNRVGSLLLDVDFQLDCGWTILFGPSGSGKTTILRSVAGFIRPDEGRISDGQDVYFDSTERTFIPAHRRRVRCAPQGGWLFPHMTVQENCLFGAGWRTRPDDLRNICRQVMASFQIEELSSRRPIELSGGEQQRASVARALISAITSGDGLLRPLLLLDEPLSGLDLAIRDTIIDSLKRWTTEWKVPVLSVTHSLAEAFQLDAKIVRIGDGRILAQGPAASVLEKERKHLMGLLEGLSTPTE